MKELSTKSFAFRCQAAHLRLVSQDIGYGIAPAHLRRADEIWSGLEKKGSQPAFENTILNVLNVSESNGLAEIDCGLMPYRCLIARLYEGLASIQPLAATGLALRACSNEVLVGKRADGAASHAGWYETTPSGGFEIGDLDADGSINVLRRMTAEFVEETGLSGSQIKNWRVSGVYYDDPTGTFDVLVELTVDSRASVPEATDEYDCLSWLSPDNVANLLGCPDKKVVDVSRWALTEWLGGAK
jgi:8-oxo-dGTP pyrophosphatase MutT (NUDIX family)